MIALILLSICLLTVIGNLLVFRGLRPARPTATGPLVSILVPARNEILNIGNCVGSLLAQDHPHWELLVLDDHSEDGTGGVVRGLFAGAPKGRRMEVIDGRPLPDGWVGKCWACHQLSEVARGEYLLFLDADTVHAPGTVTAAIDFARSHRSDLVSAWPRMLTVTLGEKLIIPIIALLGFVFCAHWLVELLQRYPSVARRFGRRFLYQLGAGNGQFMLFSRAGYDRIGGHEGVRGKVAEDVALGRAMTSLIGEGLRVHNCESIRFSTVRMYRSFGETWGGFTKNIRGLFERNEILFWIFVLGIWAGFLAPFVAWLWAPAARFPLLRVTMAMAILLRVIVTWRFRLSWLGALLHPVGVGLMLGIALRSWWISHFGEVSWKGRTYRPEI